MMHLWNTLLAAQGCYCFALGYQGLNHRHKIHYQVI
jgi:hypothetical protein